MRGCCSGGTGRIAQRRPRRPRRTHSLACAVGRPPARAAAARRRRAPPRPDPSAHRNRARPDTFLEELVDTAPEADCDTQTDEFLARPATPPFAPATSGLDAATQIEPGAHARAALLAAPRLPY